MGPDERKAQKKDNRKELEETCVSARRADPRESGSYRAARRMRGLFEMAMKDGRLLMMAKE